MAIAVAIIVSSLAGPVHVSGRVVREPVFMRLVNEDEAQSPPRLFKHSLTDTFKVLRKLFSNFCGYILELVTVCFAFKPYPGIWPDRVGAKPCTGR